MSATGAGLLFGKWPATIKSYDQDSRTCEIEIPGQTDGSQLRMIAEIEYPIGDKSNYGTATEIEVLAGDLVWIEFIQGDPRYPLITGWRNPTQGNSKNWRRWHHANLELLIDGQMRTVSGGTIYEEAGESINLKVGESSIFVTDSDITLTVGGSTAVLTGSDITLSAGTINLN